MPESGAKRSQKTVQFRRRQGIDACRSLAPATAKSAAQRFRALWPRARRPHADDIAIPARDQHRMGTARRRLGKAIAMDAIDAPAPCRVGQHHGRGMLVGEQQRQLFGAGQILGTGMLEHLENRFVVNEMARIAIGGQGTVQVGRE